jgi:tRNA A-37 threonylcarbamoyl transferase component Bud32
MTERWDRVTSLFGAARALDADLRRKFLALACEGDDGLRTQVEALLSSDAEDDGFLEEAPWTGSGRGLVEACLVAGQLLKDRYRIEEVLATGGQALVCRARDLLLSRPVVIKLMRAEGPRNRVLKSRFEREMKALAHINDPGVVGILDVGELADGTPFLVIQDIPGMSLREALSRGPMPGPRAALLLRQIGAALRAAHRAGIAHADLKPDNVMLQRREGGAETVRLIDFGIAKVDASTDEPGTTVVMIEGTVRYMAPEQFEGRNTTASDVYSMGLLACEMLCGQPDVRALPRETRRETRAVLEEALAFAPEDRPADVHEWCDRLAATLGAERRGASRWSGAGIALPAILALGAAAAALFNLANPAEVVRVVEKVGAFDPLAEGFERHGDVTGGVAENSTRTGYDGWRLTTSKQGSYFHRLTTAQKRRAVERGWEMTAVMKVEEGALEAGVDLAGTGAVFDLDLLLDGDREIVRLVTRIVPDFRGLEVVQSPARAYHRYDLIYDPSLGSADLWIDGERRLAGYHGHRPFLEERGVSFGGSLYKSERGSGMVQSVRFAINP